LSSFSCVAGQLEALRVAGSSEMAAVVHQFRNGSRRRGPTGLADDSRCAQVDLSCGSSRMYSALGHRATSASGCGYWCSTALPYMRVSFLKRWC